MTVEMGNVVVPPHHQKAPKVHPAQKEIMAAAREIDDGKWIPDPDPERDHALAGLGLALGMGTAGVAVGEKPAFEEFRHTWNLDQIGRHPRVAEALEKMKLEVYAPPDPQAALERNFAQRELAAQAAQPQKWDGQGRWEGHENEEMRYGQILTPDQWYDKLGKVVGKGRIKLGDHMVKTSPEARSGRIGVYMRNPEWQGHKRIIDERPGKVRELREKGLFELTRAKILRRLGRTEEAEKRVAAAGEMAEEAMRLQMDMSAEQQLEPTEFLRVGTVQWPASTEWMIMTFTEFGAVYAAKYLGWRTALLTMMRAGAITEAEAHKAFPVSSGPAAAWYLEQLQMLRDEQGIIA